MTKKKGSRKKIVKKAAKRAGSMVSKSKISRKKGGPRTGSTGAELRSALFPEDI
jgi:hypothetical protein